MKRVWPVLVLVHICPISSQCLPNVCPISVQYQAPSRNMNTVVAASFSAGVYTYVSLYVYIMLCYTYTVSISYVRINVDSAVVRTTKPTLYLHKALCNIAQNILHIHTYIFGSKLCPTTAVQQTHHVDTVGGVKILWGSSLSLIFCNS